MSELSTLNKKQGSIGKATAWSLAAEIAAKLIVPITNMVLARILTPSAFGIIATLNIVISFAETFSTAGFQKYLIQHDFNDESELNRSSTVAFWTNLFISIFAWMIITCFSSQLADAVGCEGYGIPLLIAALSLPLTALSTVHEALFQRKLEYRVLFIRRVVVSLLPFVVTIPLALLGLGYWALIIGTLSGNLVKAALMFIATKWYPRLYFSISLLKKMFSFGIWTLLESITMWACSYVDVLIISNKLGDYYTGLYKNSQSTVTGILAIITSATTSVLFASLSREKDNPRQFENIFYSFQKYVAIFVLPIGVGMFCFKDTITLILLGEQWYEASDFIGIWGLCTSLVCVFGTFCREVYRAKGEPHISLIVQLIHLVFIAPVCMISVKHGFDVLIYARSFAFLQIIIVHLLFTRIRFKLSIIRVFDEVKEPILCSLIMGGFALLFRSIVNSMMAQLCCIGLCALIYFAILAIFPSYRKIYLSFFDKIKKVVHK